MKRFYVIALLGCSLMILGSSCKKKDLSPTEHISCPTRGIENANPLHSDFQAILDKYVAEGFPGISAAISTPDGLWVGTSGLADIKNRVALNTCHVMFSGSVAKMYTVAAAMRLYEQGLLDLDAPISDYLTPDMADKLPNGKTATIRQLMNHTAGMPDHDDDQALGRWVEDNDGALPSATRQLEYLYDDAPRFAAGTSVEYSSAHTLTLSLIIDKIADMHHSDLVTSEIIQKLDLTETYYKNETGYPSPRHLVNGYLGKASKNKDITEESINYCMGSQGDAGIIASAHDYYLFMKGLAEGEIISAATLDTMQTAVWPFDDGQFALGFGLGLFLIKKDGILTKVGHSGGTLGGMTHVYHYPTHDSYIILATNSLMEDNADLLAKWSGAVLVGTGSSSIMDDLEQLVLQ